MSRLGSFVPLYQQVSDDMRKRIEAKSWRAGDRLPTETELSAMYGVSRITIRQAVDILAREGRVHKQPGIGTFLVDPLVTVGARRLTSFSEELRQLGLSPQSRVLQQRLTAGSREITARLGLRPRDEVVTVERLRLGDGQPIGLQTAWLPARLFPGLQDADLAQQSLYDYLRDTYGVVPSDADETFAATSIQGHTAELLAVSPGSCGLLVERITRAGGRPIELVSSVMRSDRYRIHIRLHRLDGS